MQILHLKNYIHIGTGKNLYIPTLTPTQHLTGTKGLISNIYKYEEGYSSIEEKLGFKIDPKRNG